MSAIFITSKVINYTFKTIIFKTIASLFFVALGIYLVATTPGETIFKVFTLLGLCFGLLGDVLLGFKYITTKTKNIWILAGMFAFAFGHIFYILGLFLGFYVQGNVLFIILPFVTSSVLSCLYMIISRRLGVHFGRTLFPFAVFYISCLTLMVSTAFYMALLHSFSLTTLVMFFIGAVFFTTSDCMLTGSYFKKGKRAKPYVAICSICYYVAQFLIAFSIFFL